MIAVESLSNHPEWIGTLAGWHFAEWQHLYPEWTLDSVAAELALHRDPNRVPTTLVAVEDGVPVGSVSLIEKDLSGWDHLTPWLASLYVLEDRRGRGLGRLLVARVVDEARRFGIPSLYLFMPKHRAFYASLGWTELAVADAAGERVTVMRQPLG